VLTRDEDGKLLRKLVALSFCDKARSSDRRSNLEGPKMSNWMSVEKVFGVV